MDLMGPTKTESLSGKWHIMVVVDDFTRYTWVTLLRAKSDVSEHIEALCTRLQNEKSLTIDRIRSDLGEINKATKGPLVNNPSGSNATKGAPIDLNYIVYKGNTLHNKTSPPFSEP